MMSSLSHLRALLRQAAPNSSDPLTADTKRLDNDIAKLRAWLGESGSAKPPQEATASAVREFMHTSTLQDNRHARLVCFGCIMQIPPGGKRLIEDDRRFAYLLRALDEHRPNPRVFRRFYKGLLDAYFGYDPDSETALPVGRANWQRLREYLRGRVENTVVSGTQPDWAVSIQKNTHLFDDNPGDFYGHDFLSGASEEFENTKKSLGISENSWLIWQLVLGQVNAAIQGDDRLFLGYLPKLLDLLGKHSLARDKGIATLLGRYRACRPITLHPELRDLAVMQWGNPWLTQNKGKWSRVSDEARIMVAGWLKLDLMRQFFSLLAEDGTSDPRRFKFWEQYVDQISEMFFALGNTARLDDRKDFRDIRKKMAGLRLNLHSAGPPSNNAFIMKIGNIIIVEFGKTGNACHIFHAENVPFSLRDGAEIAGDHTALKHDCHLHWLSHGGDWEIRFKDALRSLIHTPALSAKMVDASPPSRYGPGLAEEPQTPYIAGPQPTTRRRGRPRKSSLSLNEHPPVSPPMQGTPSLPSRYGPGVAEARSAPHIAKPQTAAQPRGRPPNPPFSLPELQAFCNTEHLRVKDMRYLGGNIWVDTGNSVPEISHWLESRGFTFREGKGWWRK